MSESVTVTGSSVTDAIKKLVEFNEYLANKLDDANVTPDEFDEIAVNAIFS